MGTDLRESAGAERGRDGSEDLRADVAIVGAGIAGASIAWWLTRLDPKLSVVLLERDPGFEFASS